MFITVNAEGENHPVVVNTDKICSVQFTNGDLVLLFDNQAEITFGVKEKEYFALLQHLSIANQQ